VPVCVAVVVEEEMVGSAVPLDMTTIRSVAVHA
jgi:hypothetical protein